MIFYWMSDMKRPLYHKERFYQQMAENIKGQVRMLRFDCAAHLEANEDEYFWGRLFKKYAPEKRILYMTYSKSPQGNHTTGVGPSSASTVITGGWKVVRILTLIILFSKPIPTRLKIIIASRKDWMRLF